MIRPARDQDSTEITQLVFDVLLDYGLKPAPKTTDADLDNIEGLYVKQGGCFDVLVNEEGTIIGTVALFSMGNKCCELRKMYLHPNERGKGLGKKLVLRRILWSEFALKDWIE